LLKTIFSGRKPYNWVVLKQKRTCSGLFFRKHRISLKNNVRHLKDWEEKERP
jgi:hypothetical protein